MNFSFMISDYGYSTLDYGEVHTIFRYRYVKKNNMVSVIYSKKNDYVEITFFKDINQFQPTSQDGKHSLGLNQLIFRKKNRKTYHFEDYDIFMPSKIGFDKSLEKIANMLKEFGHDILKGKNWKGWAERL